VSDAHRVGGDVEILGQIQQALIDGLDDEVGQLTRSALDQGVAPGTILQDGLIAAMMVVGKQFREYELFLPDVLLAARAMYAGLALLEPLLDAGERRGRGTVVIGTVSGDLHDIGKNLVGIMLRGAGFEVVDLGRDVAPETFVEAARKHDAFVVGMSALLTTTMPEMAKVVAALDEAGLGHVHTIVGGAPVSPEFAADIGADAHGFDAARVVEILSAWVT